jgi:adenylate kinase family enzyme
MPPRGSAALVAQQSCASSNSPLVGMHLVPIPDVHMPDLPRNTPPYASRATPKNLPRLHWLAAVIGSRNSGKTTAALKFLKAYVLTKSYDRVIWFSPTASREEKTKDFQEYCEKHGVAMEVHDNYSDAIMAEKVDWIRGEIDAYKRYLHQLEVWKRFLRTRNVDKLSFDDLQELEAMGWEEPTTEYKHGYPSFCIGVDDCACRRDVFNASCKGVMANFAILHRHCSCSMLFLMQIVANGIPRGVRGNISLWMLFPTKSATLKKAVAEEIAFKIEPEMLIQAWDLATKENPHDFLYCDYDSPTLDGMFRRGFTHKIVMPDAGA